RILLGLVVTVRDPPHVYLLCLVYLVVFQALKGFIWLIPYFVIFGFVVFNNIINIAIWFKQPTYCYILLLSVMFFRVGNRVPLYNLL
ncbi:hypothetical protein L9F63_017402, partial [Diploptera punctata]